MHEASSAYEPIFLQDGQDLGTLIYNEMFKNPVGIWLPIDKLFALVTPHNIKKALYQAMGNHKPPIPDLDRYVEDYAEKFCLSRDYQAPNTGHQLKTSRRCLFAVLTLSKQLSIAPCFVDSDFWDMDLPLTRRTDSQNLLVSWDDGTKKMAIPREWEDEYPHYVSFDVFQRWLLSPFFDMHSSNDVSVHEIEDSCVLPFIEEIHDKSQIALQGFHGTVRKVKIHPAHHNFSTGNGENPYFAVKQLAPSDSEGVKFESEVRAWAKSVGVAGHQHIIRLLATWHYRNSWNLLFLWADGNLQDYWRQNSQGNQRNEGGDQNLEAQRRLLLAKWSAKQLLGLADGLAKIHRSPTNPLVDEASDMTDYGIHGDIKPHNILRFRDGDEDYGRLVICDFGFTRFHSRASRSAAHREGDSPTYRAPECARTNGSNSDITISRACDLWALGCVYLEFMVWYLQGFDAEEDFATERNEEEHGASITHDTFFLVTHTTDKSSSSGAIVKRCVKEVSSETLS